MHDGIVQILLNIYGQSSVTRNFFKITTSSFLT
jgi:hypothetical protein